MSDLGEIVMTSCDEQRVEPRRVVNLLAYAREAGADVMPVRILDLTSDGCRFETKTPLEQGTSVWVKLPGIGVRRARVAWSREQQAGCEFVIPLQDATVDQVATGARTAARARSRNAFSPPPPG